jgi:phosphoribosyl-ATP pyrophosphohydrolase/phosphoribosyl-AMP cyclohydrolase
MLWADARPNAQGLVPCVVQDLRSRAVLMMAWVNQEALAHSLESGYATFWSRSQNKLWEKGATSGNRQRLVHVRLDCDGDTILYVVEAKGPACHEGHDTCFTRRRVGQAWRWEPEFVVAPDPAGNPRILFELERIIDARSRPASDRANPTQKLVAGGNAVQRAKLKEKAETLSHLLGTEGAPKVADGAADLLYHLAIALRGRKVSFAQVFQQLEERAAVLAPVDDATSPPDGGPALPSLPPRPPRGEGDPEA